jgi:hypothetical protein
MKCHMTFIVCLIAALSTALMLAQRTSAQTEATIQDSIANSPAANVYVSGGTYKTSEIYAYKAAFDGKLKPVPGSPFRALVDLGMALNKRYVFTTDGTYIYSFSIESDGAIKQVAAINVVQFDSGCGYPDTLFLDRTGATLYDVDGNYDCTGSDSAYQSFSIDNSTGELSFLGATTGTRSSYVPLSFIGDDVYVYGAQCNGNMYWSIFGFLRENNGNLNAVNINTNTPDAKSGDFYCPNLTTADPTHHVAISMQAVNGYTFGSDGPPQLASYTAESAGNLTTTNTRFNMPRTAVQYVTDIAMSPSGKLLAVSGTAGLQIFHFNGSKPITHYTGLLTKVEVDQVYWDNDNHLYATSYLGDSLFVFTVTPTSVRPAPGSPYTIPHPVNIAVLLKN